MTVNISIPAWNSAGVLPPVFPDEKGTSGNRSPYSVDLVSLVEHFATTPERREILDGFLRYRSALHQAGIVSGFQWLDGSFVERVEMLESRAPQDVDMVLFFDLPNGLSQQELFNQQRPLFDQHQIKKEYLVDAYFAILGQPTNSRQVKQIAYWYSIWSHRRNGLWKGFLQVDLNPSQDKEAQELLKFHGDLHHE